MIKSWTVIESNRQSQSSFFMRLEFFDRSLFFEFYVDAAT